SYDRPFGGRGSGRNPARARSAPPAHGRRERGWAATVLRATPSSSCRTICILLFPLLRFRVPIECVCLRRAAMLTSVTGVYRNGQVILTEQPQNLPEEAQVIVTFLTPPVLDLAARGI